MKRIFVFLALLTLTILAAGCGGETSNAATVTAAEPPPLPADVQEIATSTVVNAVTSEVAGDTLISNGEFISPVRSELASKIPGRVARMYVDDGSLVTRGQPVLALETDYLRLQLQAAEAEQARAKAMRDEASRDLARKKELAGKESIPQATFDRSQAMDDQAAAAYAGATAQVNMVRQQIEDSVVRSPISGVVAENRTDVGQRLGDATVAVVVVQLSPLRLRFTVPERYLGKIQRGQNVIARVDPYANETFTGTIQTVGGVIDPQTRTMFAEAEFPNRDGRLRPGLFARVEAKLN